MHIFLCYFTIYTNYINECGNPCTTQNTLDSLSLVRLITSTTHLLVVVLNANHVDWQIKFLSKIWQNSRGWLWQIRISLCDMWHIKWLHVTNVDKLELPIDTHVHISQKWHFNLCFSFDAFRLFNLKLIFLEMVLSDSSF